MIQDCQEETDALEFLDLKVLKETPASQEAQVVLEVQEQKATWEKWDSQDQED